jgi:hypothetical protein
MSFDGQKLFGLLPALYRLRDAQAVLSRNLLSANEQAQLAALQNQAVPLTQDQQSTVNALTAKASRGPLQSLLMVINEQIAIVEEDLDQLYDNQFIETCAPWVIPYIGDLIGYQPVHGEAAAVASPRAEVANTISLRRRKGTVLALEQLARDVTGWGTHAVEFFQLLAATQYMNHIRPSNYYAPDLRQWQPRADMNSGFDRTAHTVDVRRIAVARGRYNIQNIGIFLWSLNAYSVTQSPATPVAANPLCFRFSSLGRDTKLFNHPQTQGLNITTAAGPLNVPDALRRLTLRSDIQGAQSGRAAAAYYGTGLSLVLQVDGKLVPATAIQVSDLSGNDGSWINMPAVGPTYLAAIDPELGRIALAPPASGPAPSHDVRATYYHGFNADMGGGEYSRASSFPESAGQPVARVPGDFTVAQGSIQAALTALAGNGVVEITDSGVYAASTGLTIDVKPSGHIQLRAADGCRPTLLLGAEMKVSGGQNAAFDLNGILIAASMTPANSSATLLRAPAQRPNGQASQISRLGLTHCTLVPGWTLTSTGDAKFPGQPALVIEPSSLQVAIAKSILGAIRASELAQITITDSLIDANGKTRVAYAAVNAVASDQTGPGGALTLTGCTVIGKVHASLLSLASNCIFWSQLAAADSWNAPVWADRKQAGCVRFSYLPQGATTPRQFECVIAGLATSGPLFGSLRYGDPAYGKLLSDTDGAIRSGADDGGEMGAFHFVLAPQRESDLRARIQEYLPVGMEFGIFYET